MALRTQIDSRSVRALTTERNGAQLVVVHDREGFAFLDRRPDELQNLPDFRPALDSEFTPQQIDNPLPVP